MLWAQVKLDGVPNANDGHIDQNLCTVLVTTALRARHRSLKLLCRSPTRRGQSKNPRLLESLPQKWQFLRDWPIDKDCSAFDRESRAFLGACDIASFSTDSVIGPLVAPDADQVYGDVAPDVLHYGAAVNLAKAEEVMRAVQGLRPRLRV